jgi:predicted nucleic acid-binding protein
VRSLVAIDSNVLTYLVEAIEPGYDPAADDPVLAAERIAMICTYLYAGVQFWVMPTVESEYNRIRDPSRHLRHQRAAWILLHDAPVDAPGNRAGHLTGFHGGVEDCRIVAEAEASGVATLVTRDDDLIANLGPHTKLVLQYPSAFWASLGIPPGSTPHLEPSPSNPLAHVSWWRL